MGFLRKDWDWENPAEHRMEQQEEERKDRKLWLWGLALICGGLSIYSLYYTENTIYGGAVETNWSGWAGTLTGLLIVAVFGRFFQPKKPVKNEWSKKEKAAGWVLFAIIIIGLFAVCWNRLGMRLYGFQFLSILPVAFGVDKAQKAGADKNTINAWNFMMTFALLALMTFAAPRIIGICTVEEAAEKLTEAGYTDVEYKYDIGSFWIEHILPNAEVEANTEEWSDVYLFQIAENSGEAMVEPWTGTIIAE